MNDHFFTPALWLSGIAAGVLLGYLELSWLKRSLQVAEWWPGLLLVTLVNVAFLYLAVALHDSYFSVLVFPVPVVPLAYIAGKALAYFVVQRMTHGAVHSPWKLAFLSLFIYAVLFSFAYQGFARINPTRANLEKAIRDKSNGLLEVMLWMSVKAEPNMTILMNEAIQDNNDDAVSRLIRHGADPRGDYRLRYASYETQWRITKWMLDNGVKPEELNGLSQSPDFEHIAVSHGTAELEYCIQKGFEPTAHPGVIYTALTEHPLREHHVIQPDELQALQDKVLLLLRHGADINGKGEMSFTPIFALIGMNLDLLPVLTLIIDHGADVNARSPHKLYPRDSGELPAGLTPLMLSVIDRHPRYVAILLQRGADRTLRDDDGLTALDYARKVNAGVETMRLLQ